MKTITSRQNQEVKDVVDLHTTKGRKSAQKFIAQGLRTVATFLEHNFQLCHLYVTEPFLKETQTLVTVENITLVTNEVMCKMSTVDSPSGILAVFEQPKKQTSPLTPGLVLAQIADPGNMGTLIRTCAAMGFKTVVVIEGCDPWSPKVIQASVGTIALVDIVTTGWQELVHLKKDLLLCALVVDNGSTPQSLDLHNSLLVVGNEAQGLPQEWIDQCEQRMTISMPGNTESLNAAVAGSIALYEMARN